MPTYVYECRTCQDVFEVEQRITEDPLKDCRCGAKDALKRVIQPVGVVFNGAGFHINDYAASGSSHSGGADKPASESKSEEASATSCPPEGCPSCAPEKSA